MIPTPDWKPFVIVPLGEHADAPRSIHSLQGAGDRMRAAAFAELQAREAFHWASEHFQDAPNELREAWRTLSGEEQKHLTWILTRMQELGVLIDERRVSDQLWHSLVSCKTAEEFAIYIASAEERGRRAGIRFWETLKEKDPTTAEIFRKIAEEEVSHIELARRFYPDSPLQQNIGR